VAVMSSTKKYACFFVVCALSATGLAGCRGTSPPSVTPPPRTPVAAAPTATAPPPPRSAPRSAPQQDLSQLLVRLRLGEMTAPFAIQLDGPATLRDRNGRELRLAAGRYEVHPRNLQPARQHWHVFPKTFQLNEQQAEAAYLAQWRARGHDPRIEVFGKRLETRSGRAVDNRIHWVSLARFSEEAQANGLKTSLERESVWAWVRPETIAPGQGVLEFRPRDGGGAPVSVEAPASLKSSAMLHLSDVDRGYWNARPGDFMVPGDISFTIGPSAAVELMTELPMEQYLQGVLPAEMPVSWPAAALEAQAVAARSEVLSSIASKHALEGFDFCAREHCRAYAGFGGHAPSTDQALLRTAGEILVSDGKPVPTVYSANCGGWTEHNENVWAGPPNRSLRGVSDGPGYAGAAASASAFGLSRFLNERPNAWCSGDDSNFRWTRELTIAEASRLVNQHHAVGTIRRLEPGERGVSGRLRSLRVVGTSGQATIERELAIRRAFGGLPSALFTVTIDDARGTVRFRGAGRGHGVGLCQHGARGMALQGRSYPDIVQHYFSNATMEKVQ